MQRITIHQSDLEKLKIKLNDSKYLEYIWHKFLDNPNATWTENILKKMDTAKMVNYQICTALNDAGS